MDAEIFTDRLVLRSMTPGFLAASLDPQAKGAADALIGLRVPPEWQQSTDLARMRLEDLRHDPDFQPWSLRAMGECASGRMIGHIGFHTRPAPDYLAELAPGGIEIGFEVYAPWRRQGFAREAVLGMMACAHDDGGATRFVVSIAPSNVASRQLASSLGFVEVGCRQDEVDGIEIVSILDVCTPAGR